MKNIERVLTYIKNDLHMNKSEFCRLIGESTQTLNNWDKRGSIPADKLVKISESIDKSVDWIMTGNDFISTDRELLSQLQLNYSKADIASRYAVNLILKPKPEREETIRYIVKVISTL